MYRIQKYRGYALRVWTTNKVEILNESEFADLVLDHCVGVDEAKRRVDLIVGAA
jgi:hypothetical protein